jgi:hypothetical protein
MTEDLLRTLSDLPEVHVPPLAEVEHRAAVLRRRRRRRRALGVGGAASVLAVTVVLGLLPGAGAAPDAAAAEVLTAAGKAAGEQPGGWADATYWHVTSEIQYAGQDARTRQSWLAHDGEGAFQDAGLFAEMSPDAPTGEDGVRTETLGPTVFYAGDAVDWDGLYALPTEPTALEARLRGAIDGSGPDDDTELWEIVKGLLGGTPASPDLRAALWQVAATIPGVESVGSTTDALGRPGVALERTSDYQGWGTDRLVVDTTTGRLLEVWGDTESGTTWWRQTYVDQGPADSAPVVDPPICGPGSDPYQSC